MGKIIEAAQLPEKDRVFLKKDIFGWRVVHPIRNEDGKINWINLLIGGWGNFFFLIVCLLIIGGIMYSYNHDITTLQEHYKSISEDPIVFCKGLYGPSTADNSRYKPNVDFNITLGGDINE